MPHAVSIATPGLQALILCGPGSSFPTFTANPDENPKALLPIANRPMVWYPLEFCYRAGITNITVICPPSAEEAISTALKTNPFLTSLPFPRPDLLAPKDLDQNTGTAEILRLPELQEIVTSDFLVLPCDLVCELGADKLLQAWMVKSASLEDLVGDSHSQGPRSGGMGVWYPTKTGTPIKGEETDFVATIPLPPSTVLPAKGSLFPDMAKVVYSLPTDSLKDLLEEKKGFPLRHALLRQHPRVRMLTTHRDAHIYIFPHWVMQLIKENERLETLGEDVVGWWAKSTWQKGLSSKVGLDTVLRRPASDTSDGHLTPSGGSTTLPPRKLALDSRATDAPNPVITLLLQISLQLAKLPSLEETGPDSPASPFAHARKVAYPEGVKSRTTITKADSLVADNVTVQEKTSIKETVVGANCQIGEGAKLSQCLLMDGVVVGKNCKLTKCILGKRSEIGEGCVLTECEVQENLLVEVKTEAKDEKFMSSSGLEATEQELDAFDDDDGIDAGGDDDAED
ncbi:hypothetical protein NEMBOFW57_010192 [Staphylotrichum longicolle]|uniref:Mannose-1-phosphate guanyltransferase n=1 Tax=Staphylotrichum longicolle TaxID=669026 RepID=A0AAD4EUE5_9PEZI|nr:hypothetical protein NEMBOFW57_010192 [Staphylotrichum longicolle]